MRSPRLLKLIEEANYSNSCAESMMLKKIRAAQEPFQRLWESKAAVQEAYVRMLDGPKIRWAVKNDKTDFSCKRELMEHAEAERKARYAQWEAAWQNHATLEREMARHFPMLKPFADIRKELDTLSKCHRGNAPFCSEFARGCPDYYRRGRLGEMQIARARRVNIGRPIDVLLGMTLDLLQSKLDSVQKELDRKHRLKAKVRPCMCKKCKEERELGEIPDSELDEI